MAPKKQKNLRITELTERQLQALVKQTGMTETQLIIMAIDHLAKEHKVKTEGS